MKTYKRYIVFGYDQIKPKGGTDDIITSYRTLDEIKGAVYMEGYSKFRLAGCHSSFSEIQIFDTERRQKVFFDIASGKIHSFYTEDVSIVE